MIIIIMFLNGEGGMTPVRTKSKTCQRGGCV